MSTGYLAEGLDRTEELHLEACRTSHPAPENLVRLRALQKSSEYGLSGAVESYAPVLADEGLSAYRKLAEGLWRRRAVRPARLLGDGSGSTHRRTEVAILAGS